jgi:Dolichyl-phosphate-mannose-protein mannosyltransferase
LALVLMLAGAFRLISLGYSEFQGDEVKAMMPAAHVLEGDPDALMLGRKKGPAEILLPMLSWQLTETTGEAGARLPFALAGLGTLATLFLLGRKLGGDRAGIAAAGVAALNGLLIAFSRIVQYQAIVMWMSALAVLCAWEWYERGQTRWAILAGVFTGIGLLAHYDALAVVPVLAYIAFLSFSRAGTSARRRACGRDLLLGALCTTLLGIAFYGPFLLTPQVGTTGDYLNWRIGEGLLKDRIDSFLTYSIFYCSFVYVVLTGGLVLGYIAWLIHRAPAVRRIPGARIWAPALIVLAVVALMLRPAGLAAGTLDLAPIVWLLIFLAAVLLPSIAPPIRGALVWLATTFVGYNFLLADPRTHIYGIFLPWSLLAGIALAELCKALRPVSLRRAGIALAGVVAVCLCPFLVDSYLRHNAGSDRDRGPILEALAWAPEPYATPPLAGVFGVVHRAGWKGIGALFAGGTLSGDFDSNEKPELTDWYVSGAHRLSRTDPAPCGTQPRYYFLADDLVSTPDRWAVSASDLAGYAQIGRVELTNGKGVTIYERSPAGPAIGRIDERTLSPRFDEQATPAPFAAGPQPSREIGANFGGLIRLAGYDAWETNGSLVLTLFWEAVQAPHDELHVFVHVEGGPDGSGPAGVWGQSDGVPSCGGSPTGTWQAGDRIVDRRVITPAANAAAGSYSLIAGLYRPGAGERLPVLDETGNPVGDSAVLEPVALPLR